MDLKIAILFAFLIAIFFMSIHSCLTKPQYLLPAIGQSLSGDKILVALGKYMEVKEATLKAGSLVYLNESPYNEQIKLKLLDKKIKVQIKDKKIWINDEWKFEKQVRISLPESNFFYLDNNKYNGTLIIHNTPKGLLFVNEVELEDYVAGVVEREMGKTAPEEAIKAQAIAVRTYTLYQKEKQKQSMFHVYDDWRSQVYRGVADEYIKKIVSKTRGLVLTSQGSVFPAYYHSTCGGATEDAHLIFKDEKAIPALSGVTCQYCKDTKHYRWTTEIDATKMARALFPEVKDPGKVIEVIPQQKLKSQRIKYVKIQTDKGQNAVMDAHEQFRLNLGAGVIKSTLIETITRKGDKFIFTGRGWGHGAGMCQSGAIKMAQEGKDYKQILSFYYKDAKIKRLEGD